MFQRLLLIWVSVICCFNPALQADVTIKTFTRGSGYLGMGGGEGTTTRCLQGEKAREDNQFKFSSKMMKLVSGGDKNGTHIIRVDLDKIWRLNPKNKTYTETSISAPPAPASPKKEAPAEKPSTKPSAEEKPTHRIKDTSMSVKKTGAKKTINGFPTEETEAKLKVDVEEIATGEVTSMQMISRFWATPWTKDLKQAVDEELKFQKSYMAKMGLSFSAKDREMFGGAGLGAMLGVGDKKTSDLINQLKEKTKDINGYPIVTESEWRVTEDPKAVERKKAEAKASESNDSPDFTGSPENVATNLFGSFAKKKYQQKKAADAKAKEGKPQFFTYFEVKSVDLAKAPTAEFEIPAGYKKVK